ncbi:MAG: prolipoprotein diacylglyceryl transferase family protein [Gemmataceae bacterium]
MFQVLWRIPVVTSYTPDGIPIYGFGMMLFLAFLLCTWLAGRRAEREGIRKETVQDLAIWVFIGGLLGARITYLLNENPRPSLVEFVRKLPLIWEGGIVLYGSILGGVASYFLAYALVYRKQGLHTRRLLDAIAPAIALGLCLGRMGCFLNGCCFGQVACADCAAVTPVGFPMCAPARDVLVEAGAQTAAGFTVSAGAPGLRDGVRVDEVDPESPAYAAGLRPGSIVTGVNGEAVQTRGDLDRLLGNLGFWRPRGARDLTLEFRPTPADEPVTVTIQPRTLGLYPTQLYEVVSMLLLMLVLLAYYPFRHNPGQVCAVLMVGYGVHRFLNEILRDDPRPVGLESYGSVFLVATGLMLWLWLWRKQPDPPALTPAAPAATAAASAPSPA